MIDSIDRQAVLDAIQAWGDNGEYVLSNATILLLKRISNIPTDWIKVADELPVSLELVNVICKDGLSGTGYYNRFAEKWYLLLDDPKYDYFLNMRDPDYVDKWKRIPR